MSHPTHRMGDVRLHAELGNLAPSISSSRLSRPDSHSSYSPTLGHVSLESEEYSIENNTDSGSDIIAATTTTTGPPPLPSAAPPAAPPAASPAASPAPSSKPSSPLVELSNPMGGGAQTVSSKDPKAVALAATDMKNVVRRKLTGYVGFANLPNQWHRKSVRKGFNFNVMVVGKHPLSYIGNGYESVGYKLLTGIFR